MEWGRLGMPDLNFDLAAADLWHVFRKILAIAPSGG